MTSRTLLQRVVLRTPLARVVWPPYRYMFTPPQLAFLGRELELAPAGSALEIGCANGDTTVWLNRWLAAVRSERQYFAIDTFSGFTTRDIAVEADRGRDPRRLSESFRGPTRERFAHSMRINGDPGSVHTVTADATTIDYARFAPIAFALVDVDLYRSVRHVLERLYPHVVDGGVIVVDDCAPGVFEGADEAYREFCGAHGLPVRVVHDKLGVINVGAD
jgi:O-methyltransferase